MSTEPAYLYSQDAYNNEEQNRKMSTDEYNERDEKKENTQLSDARQQTMLQTDNEISTTQVLSDDNFEKSKELPNSAETDYQLDNSTHLSLDTHTNQGISITPILSDDDKSQLINRDETTQDHTTNDAQSDESLTKFSVTYDRSAVVKSETDFDNSSSTHNVSSCQLTTDNKEDFELKSPLSEAETIKQDDKSTDHFKLEEFDSIEEKENDFSSKYAVHDQSLQDENNVETERLNRADYRAEEEYSFSSTKTESVTNEIHETHENSHFLPIADENEKERVASFTSDTTDYHDKTTETKIETNQLNEEIYHHHSVSTPLEESSSHVSQAKEKVEPLEEQEVAAEPADDEFLTPGAYLRQVREQNSMSMQQVADRLYLDMGVIKALESDNYERLPPAIFVRGYLRNYAKLMEIAPEKIMKAYEQMVQHPHAPSITPPMKQKKQTSSNDLWFKLITLAIILTLMALMALWQFYPPSMIESTNINSTENTDASDWNGFETGADSYLPNAQFNANNDSSLSTATSNENASTASGADETTSVEDPIIPKTKTVRIHLKERAWMKVTDANGEKLFGGFGRTGNILPLEGMPPFYFQVGNVDGVDVEYEGERHSIRVYPKQRGRNIYVVGGED
jgi:cytoskeleton protein RodZ